MSERRGTTGFVLLDALVALLIVVVGFAAGLGAIAVADRVTRRAEERMARIIEERNADAVAPAVFAREP